MKLGLPPGLSSPMRATHLPACHKALLDWLDTYLSGLRTAITPNLYCRSYRDMFIKNIIKNTAGIPSSESAGLEDGVTCGTSGALTTDSSLHIFTTESDYSSAASSGSGAQADPYVIFEDALFDGGDSTAMAIRFRTLADSNLYAKIRNCRFTGHTSQGVLFNTGTTVNIEFENCEFDNDYANAELIYMDTSAHVILTNCLLSGCNSFAGILVNSGLASPKITVRNLQVTSDRNDWDNASDVFFTSSPTLFDMRYVNCNPDNTSGEVESLLQLIDCGAGSTFYNIYCTNTRSLVRDDNATPARKDDLTFRYNHVQDTSRNAIWFNNLENSDIAYNFFDYQNAGAGYRTVYLASSKTDNSIKISNVDVHHNKLTKTVGAESGGDEAFYLVGAENSKMCWNYVTQCPEDAYESIISRGGNEIAYNVAENCAGQVVDCWMMWDEDGPSDDRIETDTANASSIDMYVHNIYGDCTDYAMIVNSLNGLAAHDIVVDNSTDSGSKTNVRIEDRTHPSLGTEIPTVNVFIAGPRAVASEIGAAGYHSISDAYGATNVNSVYVADDGSLVELTEG